MSAAEKIPDNIQSSLDSFVENAKKTFGEKLLSATLFGSAAEGKMRKTSDVNLILVLSKFEQDDANKISESLRFSHAAIALEVMFVLESEIALAAESFAVKFADIESRHLVLHGKDYFTNLDISRDALKYRLKQVLTNQLLRLRERYVLTNLREEQLEKLIADVAGPLRSSALSIAKLNGKAASCPKEALTNLVTENFTDKKWEEVLTAISKAREGQSLKVGKAKRVFFLILELIEFMILEVSKIK